MLRKASLFVLLLFIAACNRTPAESEVPATAAPEAASPTETVMPTDPPEPTAETALPVDATPLDGQWEGAITIAGQQLDIIVKFDASSGALTATIDIPQQGAFDLPLDEVSLDGDAVHFTICLLYTSCRPELLDLPLYVPASPL